MGHQYRGNGRSSPPIPTYSESTAATPTSATAFLGASEISDDAERQGLLRQAGPSHTSRIPYQPPTVESVRSSMDSLVSSAYNSARGSEDNLRQEIQQMELEDPSTGTTAWKRISGFTNSMHLPFRQWLPSFRRARNLLPRVFEGVQFNAILLIRVFALLFVLTLLYTLFFTGLVKWRRRPTVVFVEDELRQHIQGAVNATRMRDNLKHLTQWDHVAGTEGNFYLAKWIEGQMTESGLDAVTMERFDVYLNYPKKDGRRVAIVSPPEKTWEAKLEEDRTYPDREQTLIFHGLSKSGNVTGPLVYANYGSREDYETLENAGIVVKGSITLVRIGGNQSNHAVKVKNAETAGALGCIIYSDPDEPSPTKGKPGSQRYIRAADSVERGSVALTGLVAGDVLSPGFASWPSEGHRIKKEESPVLSKIPSIPLAWRDAQVLLQALKGHGRQLSAAGWKGQVPDVEWWTGDQTSPVVNLQNEQDDVERQPIFNVLGRITGSEQPDKKIVIGNHYDAWCFGAAEPGSGTVVLLELIQLFDDLMKYGWRPRRSIEFMAWDASEYNLIGSTEYVEAYMESLRKQGVAYINVDVAATGPNLHVDGSPVFASALSQALKRTRDPNTSHVMNNLWQEKNQKIGELGADSDYLAFQDFAGVSSIDLTFKGVPYPRLSCHETFDWMDKFGDPGFQYHKLMAQIVALLMLELADEPLLQFDLIAYAKAVEGYTKSLEAHVADLVETIPSPDSPLNFTKLHTATKLLTTNAKELHRYADAWSQEFTETALQESLGDTAQRWNYNNRLSDFETNLLDLNGGLPTRPQYKHIIFAPDKWSRHGTYTFPGPRDALEDGDWKLAQQQLDLAANIIHDASQRLLE